jgi:hypothetical protein
LTKHIILVCGTWFKEQSFLAHFAR